MRLILLLALICFCFEYIHSKQDQQQQYELNLEDRKLRTQVKQLWEHSREIFSKTELNKRYKETYLVYRGMVKPDIPDIVKALKLYDQEISEDFRCVSLQVVNDWKECGLCSEKRGIGHMLYRNLMSELKGWNATNFVQNVAYVEQKQQEVLNEYGALYYEFLQDDYTESLKLFEMDLKRCNGLPSDSVSRVMSLMRIIYGNRTEIETGLTYLYGSASVASCNETNLHSINYRR